MSLLNGRFELKKYKLRNYDFRLLFLVALVAIAGLIIVNSATSGLNETGGLSVFQKQIIGLAAGVVGMLMISVMDYHVLLKFSAVWYVMNVGILAYLHFFVSYSINNAKRWIKIGSSLTIQPSEISKIIIILVFAAYFGKLKDKVSHPVTLMGAALLAAPPLVLILKQPALSATLVHVFIIVLLVYVAGISYKWVIGAFGVGAAGIGAFWLMIHQEGQVIFQKLFAPHQVKRINDHFFGTGGTDQSYQQDNSVMAIASGQLHGKGLNNASFDSVKNGNFLSEEQSDFIWAVVGEELGFIGCCVILALLAMIIFEGVMIARRACDMEGRLIAIGIAGMFAFQTFVNVGVATALLPNTGMQLPFISAGITSQLSVFAAIGLLLNVGLQRKSS